MKSKRRKSAERVIFKLALDKDVDLISLNLMEKGRDRVNQIRHALFEKILMYSKFSYF